MYRTTVILAALIITPSVAFGEYVSESAKEDHEARNEIIQAGFAECESRNLKTLGEKNECKQEFFDNALSEYPRRGTAEYSERNYRNLSAEEAEAVLIELRDAEKVAGPGGGVYSRQKPGVVSTSELVFEGWWIQENVLGVPETTGDPWFMECKDAVKSARTVQRCPLGEGGEQ